MGEEKTVAQNRRARHDYSIEDSFESGIVLTGTEIKSVRIGKVSLSEAYARIDQGEAWLVGATIQPWDTGNRYNHEPKRPRKLLLHRSQITALLLKTKSKGPYARPAQDVHHHPRPGQSRGGAGSGQAAARPPQRHRRS
jgi:SsrA-binding protein